MTIKRTTTKQNRKESLKGIPKVNGKDLDEYRKRKNGSFQCYWKEPLLI